MGVSQGIAPSVDIGDNDHLEYLFRERRKTSAATDGIVKEMNKFGEHFK